MVIIWAQALALEMDLEAKKGRCPGSSRGLGWEGLDVGFEVWALGFRAMCELERLDFKFLGVGLQD